MSDDTSFKGVAFASLRYPAAAPTPTENVLEDRANSDIVRRILSNKIESIDINNLLENEEEINPNQLKKNCSDLEATIVAAIENVSMNFAMRDSDITVAAKIAVRSYKEATLLKQFGKIPAYADEKRDRKVEGLPWTAVDHYERYWRSWETAGFLFRDALRQQDKKLIDAITSWAWREKASGRGVDVNDFLPPTKSSRIDQMAEDGLTKAERDVAKSRQQNRKSVREHYRRQLSMK